MSCSDEQKASCLDNPTCLLKLTGGALPVLRVRSLLCHYVELLGNQLGFQYVGVGLLENGTVVFRPHATWGLVDDSGTTDDRTCWAVALGDGVVGRVAASGQAELVEQVGVDEQGFLAGLSGIRSQICVPLTWEHAVLGVLDVRAQRTLGELDLDFLTLTSKLLASSLHAAQSHERQRKRAHQLRLVNEVVRVATLTSDLQQMADSLCRETVRRLGFLAVGVFVQEKARVVLWAAYGHAVDGQDRAVQALSTEISATTVDRRWTVRLNQQDPGLRERSLHPAARSLLCVPIVVEGQTIGAMQVEGPGEHAVDDLQEFAVKTLVEAMAGPLGNAHRLLKSQRLREDLNHMVVHDLRNPLQMVRLTLQDLLMENGLSSGGATAVRSAVVQTENVLQMVGSLLDIARFEGGSVQLRRMPSVLNDHIRAVIKRLAPLAHQRRIQLTSVLSPDVPVMHLDRVLIERMIDNLIENALKHTPEGGEVTASSEIASRQTRAPSPAEPCVILSIKDTGDGISPEHRDKVFEKFVRVEESMAGSTRSPGLGLTLCRYVVEAHGGQIWVDEAASGGAVFKVALPLGKP